MGYFSWNTADTKRSIKIGSKAYLLQPNGEPPIEEKYYNGYGDFGGVDAFEWLAEKNAKPEILEAAKKMEDGVRLLGIYMTDAYYVDKRDGKKYVYMIAPMIPGVSPFINDEGNIGNYASTYTGKEINDLISEGIWEARPMEELVCIDGKLKYPLKFSKKKNAVYEELPASEIDPTQGVF